MFEDLITVQKALQRAMGYPGTHTEEFVRDGVSEQGAKEMLLAAIVECTEALAEFSWKPWKPPGYKVVDKQKFATELTDIVQFVANAAIYMDISAEDLDIALRAKWLINMERTAKGETTSE